MAKGGARTGAGRKPLSPNLKTRHNVLAAANAGMTPIEHMLGVMRNLHETPERRLDAAKSAAPYIHPKLASTETKLTLENHEAALEQLK